MPTTGTAAISFRRGLSEQGYVEGKNVENLYRDAETQYDRLPAMAAELVIHRIALIFAGGAAAACAAKAASAVIPIVFANGLDPVELGLVATFNRPDGNVAGATFLTKELTAKRLELLREIIPTATTVAVDDEERSGGEQFQVLTVSPRTVGNVQVDMSALRSDR